MTILSTLFLSFLITAIAELLCALLLGHRSGRELLTVFLVNLATNPPLVLLYLWAGLRMPAWRDAVLLLELPVVLLEALFYQRNGMPRRAAYRLSVCANVLSFAAGWLISNLFF